MSFQLLPFHALISEAILQHSLFIPPFSLTHDVDFTSSTSNYQCIIYDLRGSLCLSHSHPEKHHHRNIITFSFLSSNSFSQWKDYLIMLIILFINGISQIKSRDLPLRICKPKFEYYNTFFNESKYVLC